MVEEVQRTGDIFFPGRWLDATLGGTTAPRGGDGAGLPGCPPRLPPRLRAKVLQWADMVWRAARIVYGWTTS